MKNKINRGAVCVLTSAFLLLTSYISYSQSMQVQNAYMYLKEKNYEKAKMNGDASVLDDKTKGLAKAWLYRGQIYQAIYQDTSKKVRALDEEAQEKAVQSFVKCAELDKKDNIYKSDVKAGLAPSAGSLLSKVEGYYIPNKMYDKALVGCDILSAALPYDMDELLKRRNITPENILYIQYRAYYAADNNPQKTMETGNKLMAMNFKVALIYSSMAKLALTQKDTATALSSLDKGLALFEDNIDLLTLQIDILLKQKKNAEVKKKLESAVEISPDNDIMHAVLANLYEKLGERDKAEKEYAKAIELNGKNEYALFNLGAIYFNEGNEWNKKFNDLPPTEKAKAKEYEGKSNDNFKKAITYFEQYYQLKQDAAVKQRLRKLYTLLGDTAKADKYK